MAFTKASKKGESPNQKPESPKKAGKSLSPFPSPRKKKINKDFAKKGLRLQVRAFPAPLSIEVYTFKKSNGDDAYFNGLMQYVKEGPGTRAKHPGIDSMHFHKHYVVRQPDSADEVAMNTTGYAKRMMVNYADDCSTPEGRLVGLNHVKDFLMNPAYSLYPATSIILEDLTDVDNYASLDEHFMDPDIEYLLREAIDEKDLNTDFWGNFPHFAAHCWAGSNRSSFAHSLGFL